MGKLHELLAVEETISAASEKLLSETEDKFGKISEFFTGSIRTLERLNDSPEDKAIEVAQKQVKELPTNVHDTLEYVFPYMEKYLDTKLSKHATNQIAVADIIFEDKVIMSNVPVDFLLDMEKFIPRLRKMFVRMPTLDPSKQWVSERVGVYKTKEPTVSSQTEKIMYPVILHEATDKHPAQVKESTKDIVVGTFNTVTFSGAATTQQKADIMGLLDKLLISVKQARMRANNVEVQKPNNSVTAIINLFKEALTV